MTESRKALETRAETLPVSDAAPASEARTLPPAGAGTAEVRPTVPDCMWVGTLRLHDLAVDHFEGRDEADEKRSRKRASADEKLKNGEDDDPRHG